MSRAADKRRLRTAVMTLKRFMRPLFSPIMSFTKRLESGRLDFSRPATEIARLDRDFDRLTSAPDATDPTDISKALALLVDDPGLFQKLPRPPLPARSAMIVEYFRKLETHTPMATLPIVGAQQLATKQFMEHYLTLVGHLDLANESRGEHRSQALRQVALVGIEKLYYRLVDMVYVAECLLRNKTIDRKAKDGNKLQLVCQWTVTSLPNFFDPEAHRLRNAAGHSYWHYLPNSGEVDLSDPPHWNQRVHVDDLHRRLDALMGDCAALWDVQREVTGPAFFAVLRDAGALRVLRDPDGEHLDESLFKARMEPAMVKLAAIGWKDPETAAATAATASSPIATPH